jgi:hypothetical protein
VIADPGGVKAITTTKMALLNASVGSMIILSSIDAYLFELAGADGLASCKHRRLFPVVEQRMRIADGLARQLQTLAGRLGRGRRCRALPSTSPNARRGRPGGLTAQK